MRLVRAMLKQLLLLGRRRGFAERALLGKYSSLLNDGLLRGLLTLPLILRHWRLPR
jgi:hypothetical protein